MLFDTGWGGGCLLRVVVKQTQLTKLVFERNQGATISMSAMKAGMSRNTGRKYLRQDNVSEQRPQPHIGKWGRCANIDRRARRQCRGQSAIP